MAKNDVTRDGVPGIVARIEALGYRSLRYVTQPLSSFHVLVGPNASGKSTFLDVVAFLGDLVRAGLDVAVEGEPRLEIPHRAPDAKQLTWMRQGERFEVAVELTIPADRRERLKNGYQNVCRYEVAVDVSSRPRLLAETLWLKPGGERDRDVQRTLFPEPVAPPESIVHQPRRHTPEGWKKVVSRGEQPERAMFMSETTGWNSPFRLGAATSCVRPRLGGTGRH